MVTVKFAWIMIISGLLSCNTYKNLHNGQNITITGVAMDDKDGAFVMTKKGMFFLEGLDEGWKDKYIDKKIRVTGTLMIEKLDDSLSRVIDSIQYQTITGTRATILNPKWKLVN